MDIRLARVDDRLIHGQVTTVWSKRTNVSRIIVIDELVEKDVLRKALLEQAAPPGIQVHVLGIDRFIKIYGNPKYKEDRVLLLFENLETAKEIIEKGVKIESLNIGGVSFKNGRTKINNHTSLTETEAGILKEIGEMGVEIDSRCVASDRKEDLIEVINNTEFN